MKHLTPRMVALALAVASLSACGGLGGQAPAARQPQALVARASTGSIPPAAKPKLGQAAAREMGAPSLDLAKVGVHGHGGHEAHVEGEAGALIRAQGIWVSVGQHQEPAQGYEAMGDATGGFELALHAHPGDTLTVWPFRDAGEKRLYGAPLHLKVPAGEALVPAQALRL